MIVLAQKCNTYSPLEYSCYDLAPQFTNDTDVVGKSDYIKYSRRWENLPRANNPTKVLSEKSQKLLGKIVFRLNKQKTVALSYDDIANMTKRGNKQNKRLLDELRDVFDINYHTSYRITKNPVKNVITISYSKDGVDILRGQYNSNIIQFPCKNEIDKVHIKQGLDDQVKWTQMSTSTPPYIEEIKSKNLDISKLKNSEVKKSNVIDFKKYKSSLKPIILGDYLNESKCRELNAKAGRWFSMAATRGLMRRISSNRKIKGQKPLIFYKTDAADKYIIRALCGEDTKETQQWLLSGYNHDEHCIARERGEKFVVPPDEDIRRECRDLDDQASYGAKSLQSILDRILK